MQFLKNILSSCLGALVALFLVSLIFILVIVGMTAQEEVVISDPSVLHLKLAGPLNELEKDDLLSELPLPGTTEASMGLVQIKRAISEAKQDKAIRGIYLEVDDPQTSYASLMEIRQSLQDFMTSGKKVIAYNENLSEKAYYLASVADEVYLNPQGQMEFNGLTAQFMSFKKLLDKLEVKPQVFRVGEFKSAVEPFLFEQMSPENRLQMESLMASIQAELLSQISASRHISVPQLQMIADNLFVRNAPVAVSEGLVDSLLYKDEFETVLKAAMNLDLDEDEKVRLISYKQYQKSFKGYDRSDNEIAVIVAEGNIVPGKPESTEVMIGGTTYVEELRKARENDDIKAIVLRVNSPGGEFQASDMIWHEVQLAVQTKPVIASMGDYAASGGYYISMACDTIVAQPTTITGSIGIFGVMFDLSDFLDHKIGITFDEVRTGKYGDMFTVTRPLSESEQAYWQQTLDMYYGTFLSKAAEGRGKSVSDIRKIAGGRVWTGTQALDNGLVDVLGGVDTAIHIAAEKARISNDYKVRYYPEVKSFLETWLAEMEAEVRLKNLKSELGESYIWYQKLKQIEYYQGAQARLPFECIIK